MFRDDKEVGDNKELNLVIGCGHKLDCGMSHSGTGFVTVDRDKSVSPDIIANLFDPENFIDKVKEKQLGKFSSFIFEGSYFAFDPNHVPSFTQVLDNHSYLVFAGFHLFDVLDLLPENATFWIANSQKPLRQILIVSFNDFLGNKEMQLKMEHPKDYMKPSLLEYMGFQKNEKPAFTQIEMKKIIPLLKNINKIKDLKQYSMLFSQEKIISNILLIEDKKHEKLTVENIQECLAGYKPGFFRKNFGGGETERIKDIKVYISKFKSSDELDVHQLKDILQICVAGSSMSGSTGDVITEMSSKILKFIISNQERLNVFLETHQLQNKSFTFSDT